jgi:hypothetical protein
MLLTWYERPNADVTPSQSTAPFPALKEAHDTGHRFASGHVRVTDVSATALAAIVGAERASARCHRQRC